jgi:hypothetical protein
MGVDSSDLKQFCHEFALVTLNAVYSYLDLLEEVTTLVDAPVSDEWNTRIKGVRMLSLRMITTLAPMSVSLAELGLGARLGALDADDDIRSVQTLMQAIIDAVGVFVPLETRSELESIVVLTPDTIGRLLAEGGTEKKLASHLRRETGRELGTWPDWSPPSN